MRILLAETDAPLLAEMKRALEAAGYTVMTAMDGMAAWDHLVGRDPPDLLVTRCHLGTGTPPGTALGLYAQSAYPCIPVLYIPGPDTVQLVDANHGAVLVKPFAVSDLLDTVNRLLETRNQFGQVRTA